MIDIHCHILPGIDDGAVDLDEAVAMGRLAAEDGCRVMFATPHQRHPLWWNDDPALLASLRRELNTALGGAPEILPGAEVRVDSELFDDLEAGVTTPLGNSHYMLVEFARNGLGPAPEEIVHELVVAGWRPIVAHPELLPWLADDLPRIANLVELGAALQITAMSVTGEFGRRPRESVTSLLDAGLPHFLASDSHGVATRPPGLSRARQEVARRWGEDLAEAITRSNPLAVVEDRPLPSW